LGHAVCIFRPVPHCVINVLLDGTQGTEAIRVRAK
jgi:hypothetical protein